MVNNLLVKDELVVKVLVLGVDAVDDRGVQGIGRLRHDGNVFVENIEGGWYLVNDLWEAALGSL